MTNHEKFLGGQQARSSTPGRSGQTTERYRSALDRYLAAVAGEGPIPDSTSAGTLYWNIENNLVRDVMTSKVTSVTEDASFKQIVEALGARRISAVPVVDDGRRVLGVVSESDLLTKVVTAGSISARVPGRRSERVQARRKSNAETARELMSAPAITVHPDDSIVHAARIAAIEHVRRLPVVDHAGTLVGIVTRSDLLRVFLRTDDRIRHHVVSSVLVGQFSLDASAIDVAVQDGVVTLTGQVERRLLISPLLDAVRATAGVVGVHDELTYRIDDTVLPAPTHPFY